MTQLSPFRYFRTSPEIIRLAVMMYGSGGATRHLRIRARSATGRVAEAASY